MKTTRINIGAISNENRIHFGARAALRCAIYTRLTPADLVDHNVARVVLDQKHVVITLKSAGENSSEPIEVPWSPQKDAKAYSD